jgi:MFS transporter, PAT family, beta-lactamase induction signal transducer AmpG
LAMIWAGAGALWIASLAETMDGLQGIAWQLSYLLMAVSMLVGVVVVLYTEEPQPMVLPQIKSLGGWFRSAAFGPFVDFFQRYGTQALYLLLLVSIYRISDITMGVMANPFYVDMGFTKIEIAMASKIYGVIMTLIGAFLGGVLSMRFGVMRVLLLGAVLSSGSNLLFAWLYSIGHNFQVLTLVISADNLSSGIASAAFIAYLSSLTSVNYSATQYALFSSVMTLMPKFLAGYSGVYVDTFGYAYFFLLTALLGLPVIALILFVQSFDRRK